jgi:lipopolysaccharide export system permease protein
MDNIRLIVKRISIDNIKEKELYDKIPGLLVYVDKKLNYKTFKGMLIYNKNNNLLILSEKGHIENDNGGRLHFNLKNGSIINEDKGFTNIIYKDFKIDFNIATKWHTIANKEVFLGPLELFKSFKKSPIYKFQFSSNFAVPFASLIMAFYGYFLGFLLKTHSKEICIFISFIVILIYYLFFILFKSLIYENFNPFLAAWMPDLLLMFVLFPFFLKKIYENTL